MRQHVIRFLLVTVAAALLALPACRSSKTSQSNGDGDSPKAESEAAQTADNSEGTAAESSSNTANQGRADKTVCNDDQSVATFAGGCFWCSEPPFDNLDGVEKLIVGYAGGTTPDPTYKQVAGGNTDHAESIQICYNDSKVDYETLLRVFWRTIDPTQKDGQFVDKGPQYRTIVFYHDDAQKQAATASKQDLAENGPFDEPIVTPIEKYTGFWKAKDYHQNFYKTHPERYNNYHSNSGRYPFFKKHWGTKNPTENIE